MPTDDAPNSTTTGAPTPAAAEQAAGQPAGGSDDDDAGTAPAGAAPGRMLGWAFYKHLAAYLPWLTLRCYW